jgi:hypothetical protein
MNNHHPLTMTGPRAGHPFTPQACVMDARLKAAHGEKREPAAPSRRSLLAWTGGGSLWLACAGGVVRAAGAGDLPYGDAYSPWQLWNAPQLRGTPLALVAAGILAANPHDTQPWLFHVRDDAIEIFADLSRNLGAMDPFVREMHLGLGCAIQNMLLAAGPNGYDAELESETGSLLGIGERRTPVRAATIRLTRRAPSAPCSLCRVIPERHTNRYAYDHNRPLPAEWREFALHADVSDDVRVFLFDDGATRHAFDAIVVDATEAIIADRVMIADSDRWVRTSKSEIAKHRDGPTLEAAGLSWFTLMLARIMPVTPEMSHQAWLDHTRDTQLATAPLVGLVAVRDRYDRANAIAAGRTWQRLHLSATVNGIAMQPLNQPIEMIDRERQTGRGTHWPERVERFTGPQWQATFAFRAGYAGETAPPSPRRVLRDVIV